MVEDGGGAGGLVVDTARVELEGQLAGVNSDGDGADSGHSGLQRGLGAGLHIDVALDGGTDGVLLELAALIDGLVGVGHLSVNALVGDHVLESLVHQTALAAHVALGGGAIDEILLRKRHQLAGLQTVLTLHRGDGGESPAKKSKTIAS